MIAAVSGRWLASAADRTPGSSETRWRTRLKSASASLDWVPKEVWGERDDRRPLGIEPRVDPCRTEQAPQRDAGGGEQDDRDGDLHRHKRLTQAVRPARGRRGAKVTEHRSEVGTSGLDRWQQGEDDGAQDRRRQGKAQHPQVERRGEHELQRPAYGDRERKADATEHGVGGASEQEPEPTTGQGEEKAFEHELADHLPPLRPDGEARRNLAPAAERAGQEEAREIGGGEQEAEREGAHHQQGARPDRAIDSR